MDTPEKTTVAIVEDNPSLAESLRRIVDGSESLRCCAVWNSAEDALRQIGSTRPTVVLMDIHLPGMSGIEATARIKRELPEVQIVMVTIYAEHDKIFAALKAGASGYLLKRSTPVEVRTAIRDVLTGGAPMSSPIARRIVEVFHQPQEEPPSAEVLSSRESEVLKFLADGLSNKLIAGRLGISAHTVGVHVRHIYEKLHVHSRVEAANWYRDILDPEG